MKGTWAMRTSRSIWSTITVLALAGMTPACGGDDDGNGNGNGGSAVRAKADLVGLGSNTGITGTINFEGKGKLLDVTGDIQGLAIDSVHGFHIHENGDCSDPAGMSAGGLWNPTNQTHGRPTSSASHFGDLGNIRTYTGLTTAIVDIEKEGPTLGSGDQFDPIGRAVILHENADDEMTDPTGNAGARIACGVITAVP